MAPDGDHREQRRQQAHGTPTNTERNATASRMAANATHDRQRLVELLDHARAVAGGDRRQPVTEIGVVGILPCAPVERAVDRLDHRQDLAGVDVGQPAGHRARRSASLAMKRRTRCSGSSPTNFFTVSMRSSPASSEPAAQAFQRPDVAEARLLFQHLVRLGDTSSGPGANRPLAALPLDHDVDGIGAGQLLVDAGRWRPAPARGRAPGRPAGSAARAAGRPQPHSTNDDQR